MYTLLIHKKAQKDIATLSPQDKIRVLAALEGLREQPFAGKKLQGKFQGAWSLRTWPYRILYTIHKKTITVVVLRIRQRKDAYHG